MPSTRLRSLTVALAAASWLVVSCGASVDDRISAVADDPEVVSPINFLLGVDAGSTTMLDIERRAQESIARCMAEAGFRYVPVSLDDDGHITATSLLDRDELTLEAVQQHGYGIADRLRVQILFVESDVDPNESFRSSLSIEEQVAYDAAMSGISSDEVEWDSEREAPIDPATGSTLDFEAFSEASEDGCLSMAYDDGGVSAGALEILTSRAYQDLQDRINADEEMIALFDGWRACMSSRGYRYQGSQQIMDELDSIAGEIAHEAESDHHDVEIGVLTDRVDVLRLDEIELAVIDWECSADLNVAAPEIARRHEVEFVRENEDLIVAVLDDQRTT